MHPRKSWLSILFILVFLAGCKAKEEYRFSGSQRPVIEKLLADSAGWRLARESDNTNPQLEDQKRDQPGYHPYFLEADVDGDVRTDFVIALVHQPDTNFAVYFFHAGGSNYDPPQLLFCSPYLNSCGLFFNNGQLLAGDFYTDNAVVYRWDPAQRKLTEVIYKDDEN